MPYIPRDNKLPYFSGLLSYLGKLGLVIGVLAWLLLLHFRPVLMPLKLEERVLAQEFLLF